MALEIGIVGLILIALATRLSDKLGVASPLILLAFGVGIAMLPSVGVVEIDPEIILQGILPPLLFAAATSMSFVDFSRELLPVTVLAVALVVISALVVGVIVAAIVPGVGLAWGIALGAVVSPTDAVAVSIARHAGLSARVLTMLEGEGLLNDATALVVLSTAASVAVSGGGLSVGGVTLDFVWTLVSAIAVGWVVGMLSTWVRSTITDPTVDTLVSFTVPFLAALPAEHIGGSGLVAAVAAGLVAGNAGLRALPAANRLNGDRNWATVELVLEGAIFLVMGIQLPGIITEVGKEAPGVDMALWVAVLIGAVVVACRAAVVFPMISWLHRRVKRRSVRLANFDTEVELFEKHLDQIACGEVPDDYFVACNAEGLKSRKKRKLKKKLIATAQRGENPDSRRVLSRLERLRADLDYFCSESLGRRDALVITWAGMRGAVTLAAAQTLPATAPQRSFLVLVAVAVAAGSLTIQGLSLQTVIKWVSPRGPREFDVDEAERLVRVLRDASTGVLERTNVKGNLPEGNAAEGVRSEVSGASGADTASGVVGVAGTPGASHAAGASGAAMPAGPGASTNVVPAPIGRMTFQNRPNTSATAAVPIAADVSTPEGRAAAIRDNAERSLQAITMQRNALLDLRRRGLYSTHTIEVAMQHLDHQEVYLQEIQAIDA